MACNSGKLSTAGRQRCYSRSLAAVHGSGENYPQEVLIVSDARGQVAHKSAGATDAIFCTLKCSAQKPGSARHSAPSHAPFRNQLPDWHWPTVSPLAHGGRVPDAAGAEPHRTARPYWRVLPEPRRCPRPTGVVPITSITRFRGTDTTVPKTRLRWRCLVVFFVLPAIRVRFCRCRL